MHHLLHIRGLRFVIVWTKMIGCSFMQCILFSTTQRGAEDLAKGKPIPFSLGGRQALVLVFRLSDGALFYSDLSV